MKKADLHIHSKYSDGTLTPREIIYKAKNEGLSAVAITDHDTTEGIEPALRWGAKLGIEVIPGIELSCEYRSKDIHMLGYYINWENSWFQNKLRVFQRARERRAIRIFDRLKELNINIPENMIFKQAQLGSISRMHFARCLVETGRVENVKKAFDRYLGEGKPGFVRKLRITPEEALSMIHNTGGISVVAHPVFGGGHKSFLKKLKKMGLYGVEAYHPSHNPEYTQKILKVAQEIGLIVTGGTDSHGKEEEEDPIGSLKVDYSIVNKLKQANDHTYRKNRVILI
ncbi:MAG: PHP domain-containing protein [Elusimicrobiota bacterium]